MSSKTVGSIVGLRSSEISQTIQDYIEQKKLLEQETEELKQGGKLTTGLQSHQRQVAIIKKAIEEETEKVQKVRKAQLRCYSKIIKLRHLFVKKYMGIQRLRTKEGDVVYNLVFYYR